MSPDGKMIATSGGSYWDGEFCLWDVESTNLLRTFNVCSMGISTIKFTSDGKKIVSSSESGTTMLWDISDLLSPTSNVADYMLYQ